MSDSAKIPPKVTRSAIDTAHKRERTYIRVPVAMRIIGGLLLLIPIGTVLLMLPWAGAKGPLTFQQALFTSVSALCVTGLSVITPALDLTWFGQLILLVEIQTGGVGFMLLVIAALRIMRRRITLVDRLAVRDSLGLPEREQFAPILSRVLITVFAIEGISALFLWLNWRNQLDDVSALWYALFHAISSFCNAGFDLFAGLPQFPSGLPRDPITLIILGATIVLGGLGFPVLAELIHWRPRKRFSLHSRLTLGISMALFVGGALGFVMGELGNPNLDPGYALPQRVLFAFFQSASARTAGFALGDLSKLTPATQLLTISLMFIGTAPASMGGGITTGTFVVLLISVWSFARGYAQPQVYGRALSPELPRRAAAVLTVSIAVVATATWLLLLTNAGTLQEMLFEVVSAFATTGLSLSVTPRLNLFGQVVVMIMMIWGRLGALTIILALARRRPPEPLRYPEESVLIA